jgi:hypothetical protein
MHVQVRQTAAEITAYFRALNFTPEPAKDTVTFRYAALLARPWSSWRCIEGMHILSITSVDSVDFLFLQAFFGSRKGSRLLTRPAYCHDLNTETCVRMFMHQECLDGCSNR